MVLPCGVMFVCLFPTLLPISPMPLKCSQKRPAVHANAPPVLPWAVASSYAIHLVDSNKTGENCTLKTIGGADCLGHFRLPPFINGERQLAFDPCQSPRELPWFQGNLILHIESQALPPPVNTPSFTQTLLVAKHDYTVLRFKCLP